MNIRIKSEDLIKNVNAFDETLQDKELSAFKNVLSQFHEKKGTLVHIEPFSDQRILLFPNDAVYPACSAGFCRSQALWALLKTYQNNLVLFNPHATRYGFDPYNGELNWQKSRMDTTFDEFYEWAGIRKAVRIGFDKFFHLWDNQNINQEQLNSIYAYYNLHYFGPSSSWEGRCGKRRIYLSFHKNTHVILHRLNQTNDNLENVWVYHLPLMDFITHPLQEWETLPRSCNAYEQFSLILKECLDFSRLD